MKEDGCFSFAEFVEHSCESWVSGVDAVGIGQDLETHGAEVVKGVVDLGKRAFDIGQWKGCEEKEVFAMLGANL
jgi:hypothetical protein